MNPKPSPNPGSPQDEWRRFVNTVFTSLDRPDAYVAHLVFNAEWALQHALYDTPLPDPEPMPTAELSNKQKQRAEYVFASIDADGSGSLERVELGPLVGGDLKP